MKIRPVRAALFRTDGQTDMTKLIVAFCNFANAPKNAPIIEGKIPVSLKATQPLMVECLPLNKCLNNNYVYKFYVLKPA
jgi:hypothetical protein